jgi:predicted transport protein
MALQLTAVETSAGVGLIFTRVLDTVRVGLDEEDEPVSETTDRSYWEQRKACPTTVAIADAIWNLCRSFEPNLKQSYKKHYIGFFLDNQAFNFAVCKPRAQSMHLEIALPRTSETDAVLAGTGLDVLSYNRHFGMYRIGLQADDVSANKDCLISLMKQAYDARK